MSKKREYDEEYKVQAVKLAKNLGSAKAAAEELQIPVKHTVRLDAKSENSRIGHRMWRTQSGRSTEYCQRESAAEKADQGVGKRKSPFE